MGWPVAAALAVDSLLFRLRGLSVLDLGATEPDCPYPAWDACGTLVTHSYRFDSASLGTTHLT